MRRQHILCAIAHNLQLSSLWRSYRWLAELHPDAQEGRAGAAQLQRLEVALSEIRDKFSVRGSCLRCAPFSAPTGLDSRSTVDQSWRTGNWARR